MITGPVREISVLITFAQIKRPLKKRKTKILMAKGSLMKVESIAECSPALSDNQS